MRKYFLIGATIIFSFFALNISCKKKDIESHRDNFSVSTAKTWYSGIVVPKFFKKSTKGNDYKLSKGNFVPLWENAFPAEDPKYYIIECPIIFEKDQGLSINRKGEPIDHSKINGEIKLLILKDKTSVI
jgi:hypothetical protein